MAMAADTVQHSWRDNLVCTDSSSLATIGRNNLDDLESNRSSQNSQNSTTRLISKSNSSKVQRYSFNVPVDVSDVSRGAFQDDSVLRNHGYSPKIQYQIEHGQDQEERSLSRSSSSIPGVGKRKSHGKRPRSKCFKGCLYVTISLLAIVGLLGVCLTAYVIYYKVYDTEIDPEDGGTITSEVVLESDELINLPEGGPEGRRRVKVQEQKENGFYDVSKFEVQEEIDGYFGSGDSTIYDYYGDDEDVGEWIQPISFGSGDGLILLETDDEEISNKYLDYNTFGSDYEDTRNLWEQEDYGQEYLQIDYQINEDEDLFGAPFLENFGN